MLSSPDAPVAKTRRRLFTKYVALFVAVVCVALLSNGLVDVLFYYQEHKSSLIRIQREQAEAAAAKISQFIKEIESQLGWTTQLPWSTGSIEQRRFDALRLLRQVPAITELSQVDATGKERLRVSRLAMDVVGSGADFSTDPKFTEAVARKVYYGPVYFRRESEPYMTLAIAGTRRDAGVSIAQVNLKLIWDVVSQIKVGERGHAYVVDAQGRLIAHPDISLVLRNTDMSRLAQVQAARARTGGDPTETVQEAENIAGRKVLTAYAPVAPLGWLMFVELPAEEAYAPLYSALQRLALVLLAGLGFAVLAGMFLASRMVGPIRALRAGAARIGSGDLGQRIAIKTGDELEALADQFNDMAGQLQELYAGLENKVEQRTHELSELLEQQTATSEVLRAISSSPGDLQPVFETMLANATRLCQANFGNLTFREGELFRVGRDSRGADHLDRLDAAATRHRHTRSSARLARSPLRNQGRPSYSGPHGGPGLYRARSPNGRPGRARWRAQRSGGADAQGGGVGRCDRHISPGSEAVHRQAGRAGHELREPGNYRHRERPPADRIARQDRRARAIGGGVARVGRSDAGGQLDA